jgi:hypothetical protein
MRNPAAYLRVRSLVIQLAALLALAFVFTALNLRVSRECGRLSTVGSYDDIVYISKAAHAYFTAGREGVMAAVAPLLAEDLHAPFPVWNGFAGFLLFGFDINSVYLMLTVVVFSYLLIVWRLLRGTPVFLRDTLLLASLAVPFAGLCALEFRPDLLWATLLCGAGVIWLQAEHAFSRCRNAVWFGAMAGLVMLVKPSTFAMSFLVFGGVWFLAALRAWVTRQASLAALGKGLALSLATFLLVSGWSWIPHAKSILDYFMVHSFGANQDVWALKGTLADRLLYYVRGYAKDSNLGGFYGLFCAIYLGGCLYEILRGPRLAERIRGASFLWMIVALFAVNGFFKMKSPYLGGSFYGFLIFGAVFYTAYFIRKPGAGIFRRFGFQVLAALAILGFVSVRYMFPPAGMVNPEWGRAQRIVNEQMLAELVALDVKGPLRVLTTQGGPIIHEYLGMMLDAEGAQLVVSCAAMDRSLEEALPRLGGVDFVVLQDPGILGKPGSPIPGEELQAPLKAHLDAIPQEWNQVRAITAPDGKNVYLYRRL